jgi:hypothetical protein
VDASNTGGPTSLDAPWRLHFGDDPAYAQPGFDDSHWTLHRIDKDWASEGHKGYSGYGWYRMRVILPKGNEPLAIAIYPPPPCRQWPDALPLHIKQPHSPEDRCFNAAVLFLHS